jgi:hemolysin D
MLEIKAFLPNKDIGFVKEGEPAIVKVESYPFSRYGTIDATLTRVARDASPGPDWTSRRRTRHGEPRACRMAPNARRTSSSPSLFRSTRRW